MPGGTSSTPLVVIVGLRPLPGLGPTGSTTPGGVMQAYRKLTLLRMRGSLVDHVASLVVHKCVFRRKQVLNEPVVLAILLGQQRDPRLISRFIQHHYVSALATAVAEAVVVDERRRKTKSKSHLGTRHDGSL